jgi:hypothetical protein
LRPAKEGATALEYFSDDLRKWKWPIPPELVAFGGNGSDEHFGVWLPANPKPGYSNPVIMIGEIFEDRSFAVVGTNVCKFLTVETAILTMLCLPEIGERASKKALDALGVPANLRAMDPDTEEAELYKELYEWADPAIPDHNPDPYDRGLTAEQLRNSHGRNVT